jgi:sec-independent protein translocase protein TatB
MFDIGWGELVVIGIVALIAIGPKELPTVLRSLGQWMGKIRRMANEFQGQFQEALREAEMADLKKQAEELTSAVTDATRIDPFADIGKDVEKEVEALPATAESGTAAAASEPAASAEPAEALPPIDVPPPEQPAPVTEKDFAPAEPPPKQAGGSA